MPKKEPESNVNPEQQALRQYITMKQQVIITERARAMNERGMKDFYKFEEGTTEFILEPVIPRERDGNFGKQSIFRIKVGGTEYDWSINHKSPVYRQIIGDGLKDKGFLLAAPVKAKLVKVGEGQKTRMTLKRV
jgi:hypothetical protein